MVAGFSKWAGNLADRWVSVPCDGTFPRGGGLMGNAILEVLLDQAQRLGVSDRAVFQMLTFPLGTVSRVYLVPLSLKALGDSLHVLPLPDLYFCSTNARWLEVYHQCHAHHGWCPSGGHSAGPPFLTFSACLTPIHPFAPPLPGSLLGMEFASLPGSPVTFKESFNQLIFMWNVPSLVLLFYVSMHKTDKILPLGNLYSRGH